MSIFNDIALNLFAASTIIIFIYALLCLVSVGISLSIIFRGRREFSRGHMLRFINAFSITLAVSFLYAVWNVVTRIKIISIDNDILFTLIDNVILIIFVMMLTYVAFLARELSTRFGFRSIGKKIGKIARK